MILWESLSFLLRRKNDLEMEKQCGVLYRLTEVRRENIKALYQYYTKCLPEVIKQKTNGLHSS